MFDMDMAEMATPVIQESIKGVSQKFGIKANEIVITLKPVDEEFNFKVEVLRITGENRLSLIKEMTVKEFIETTPVEEDGNS